MRSRATAPTAHGSTAPPTSSYRPRPSTAASGSGTRRLHRRYRERSALEGFRGRAKTLWRGLLPCRAPRAPLKCAAEMVADTLEQRLTSNPACDVCTAPVTASGPHDFNGFDLLCDKCYCHRCAASGANDID